MFFLLKFYEDREIHSLDNYKTLVPPHILSLVLDPVDPISYHVGFIEVSFEHKHK